MESTRKLFFSFACSLATEWSTLNEGIGGKITIQFDAEYEINTIKVLQRVPFEAFWSELKIIFSDNTFSYVSRTCFIKLSINLPTLNLIKKMPGRLVFIRVPVPPYAAILSCDLRILLNRQKKQLQNKTLLTPGEVCPLKVELNSYFFNILEATILAVKLIGGG